MAQPPLPKIFHIVHVDRLRSIVAEGCLLCDAIMAVREGAGTTIGMSAIKRRRLILPIACRPGLKVGECVPFYWCPRSVMLYLIHQANHPDLSYKGGQSLIVHIEADMYAAVNWAARNGKRWAFTLSNAGSTYFEDRCDVGQLNEIDWESVQATRWAGRGISPAVQEGKQAEFMVEHSFPLALVERVGVYSDAVARLVDQALDGVAHRPPIEIRKDWYY